VDWSNERYVRIYTRDTKTWKLLGWEGQAVLCLLARRFDRSGLLDDVRSGEDVALMIGSGFPEEIAHVGLDRILKHDVMVLTAGGLLWPKFMEAQEASKSNTQRQREFRDRRRAEAKLKVIESVSEYSSKPIAKSKRKIKMSLPDSWEPTPDHEAIAREQGVELKAQAELFRDHYKANGELKADWDATFRNWLRRAREFSRGRAAPKIQGTIDFLKREISKGDDK
jgi:hypothetical protein